MVPPGTHCHSNDMRILMEKKRVQMVNWYFGLRNFYGSAGFAIPFTDKANGVAVLMGNTIGHPKYGLDGAEYVMTSRVLRVNFAGREVETMNTIYELIGEPSAEWVKWLGENDYLIEGVNITEEEIADLPEEDVE